MKSEIIVKNKFIPFGEYDSMALWPFIFTKKDLKQNILNHERIHLEQQKELLIIGFYILYILFFIYEFIFITFKDWNKSFIECWDYAYIRNPFELEAYSNEKNENYLNDRKRLAWIKGTSI